MLKLLRYNLRVVLANNWWLLVFPIAVSQLTVFWTIITRKFAPQIPAETAELVTPLLAAFLCAHVMTAEYQSRVGAILASKPLHMGKVVLLRLGAVLSLVFLLEVASLVAYYYGMEPYDLSAPLLASIPSTLFLSMLALTFGTLFRNALAGFAVAALFWSMDLPPGPPINAFLSLRSYSTFVSSFGPNLDALVSPWWISKALLLVGAVVLYLIHSRLVFGLGVVPSLKAKRKTIGWAAGIIALTIVSGACAKVFYGYSQRGKLQPNDAAWFRQQFSPYGPIPVAYAFGPAFRRYLGDTNGWRSASDEGDSLGDTLKHHRELREVVERMPNSIWAPSSADLLGRVGGRKTTTVEERVAAFQSVADTYPQSPYVDVALREKARIFDGAERQDDARKEYEEMLKRRPTSQFRTEALRYITGNESAHGNQAAKLKWARLWAEAAPVQDKFMATLAIMEALQAQNDLPGARDAAKQTLDAVRAFRAAVRSGQIVASESSRLKWERQAVEASEKAKALQ